MNNGDAVSFANPKTQIGERGLELAAIIFANEYTHHFGRTGVRRRGWAGDIPGAIDDRTTAAGGRHRGVGLHPVLQGGDEPASLKD